ncbi:hypothetical protein BGZ83_000788 [Gryganskiella cystojenkinii]|nr:hypothetical protein BGZ83_000788 [Gryganskiella cystojenkinii]
MSWSQLSNTITCNDSKVNFSLLTLATQDGTDKIFRESQNFISAIEDDLTAQKVTNVDDVISGMTSIYWTGLNNTHYTLAPSAGGEYSRTLEGYTLPNFDSWLAPFIDGATISTGYICHNCFTNRGPFNGAFWAKFLVGLSSLGSTMFTVTAMILTYKFVVEFQAKVRDELTGSEHVSTIDKEDSVTANVEIAGPGPISSVLQKHAHFVRSLFLFQEGKDFSPTDEDRESFDPQKQQQRLLTCPNLASVHLIHDTIHLIRHEDSIVKMLQRHPTIKDLFTQGGTTDKILDALEKCPQLRILRSLNMEVKSPQEQWVDRYESLWSRLRVILLRIRWFQDQRFTPEMLNRLQNARETNIEDLTLLVQGGQQDMLPAVHILVSKSPNLKRLTWFIGGSGLNQQSTAIKLLAEGIRSDRGSSRPLQQLESLNLPWAEFNNADFLTLLQATTSLTELNLLSGSFDVDSWKVLKVDIPRHLWTLKILDLRQCKNVTGKIIQDVLCSMLALEIFFADAITDLDLVNDPRPWVATGLKKLSLAIGLYDLQRRGLILTQLARLESLESLNLSMNLLWTRFPDENERPQGCLSLDLENGLDQLKTLRRLRTIIGPGLKLSKWKVAEARWVIEYWVRLRAFEGIDLTNAARKLLRPRFPPVSNGLQITV